MFWQKHYKTFYLFVTLVLGGGERGVKKETKGIKFFIRHRLFDVAPKQNWHVANLLLISV